jgi:PAS domain S-box-containing protein
VGEGLLILEDERIVYTNEAFSQISGHGSSELMALPSVLDLVVPEERASFGERLRRRLGGRADKDDQETVILHKSGRRVIVETGIKTTQENGRPGLSRSSGTSPSARRRRRRCKSPRRSTACSSRPSRRGSGSSTPRRR